MKKTCKDCLLFNRRSYMQYGICSLNNEDTNEEAPACWQFEAREKNGEELSRSEEKA